MAAPCERSVEFCADKVARMPSLTDRCSDILVASSITSSAENGVLPGVAPKEGRVSFGAEYEGVILGEDMGICVQGAGRI